MASQKNLITQARLQEVKFAQNELVDNLYAHVNASLSKAHGIELYYLPHPTLDGNGNDISIYFDSHGDRVGYYFMRLTFNNTNYYAPLEITTLAGKDPMTGISPDTNVGVIVPVTPGGSAWTTDFTPEDEQDLIVTNNSVLYPHTLLSHWETHTAGVYQIFTQATYDSAGHKVGTHVARVVVDGVEYWIPCTTAVGGIPQPMRLPFPAINTLQNTNCNWCSMGRDDNQYGYFWYNAPTGGTLPYTFKWQLNSYKVQKVGNWWSDPNIGSGTWNDLVGVSGTMGPGGPAHVPPYNVDNPEAGTYSVVGNKLTLQVSTGDDSGHVVATVRGKYTNVAGSVYTNWCLFKANDEDGSWIFADPDVNQSATHVSIKNDPVWVDGYYYPPGPP